MFTVFVYIDCQEMHHLFGHALLKNELYMFVCGFWLYCGSRCHNKERGNQCMHAAFVNYIQFSVRIRT